MMDIIPPKRWPVFKHKNKDLWVVRDLQGAEHSCWMLTHCRAVAEAWTCRSKELEADLAQAQQQEAIYRAEVVRHGASDERDGQAKIRVRELEKKCAALGRVNDDLSERCTELQRRISQRQVSV
jgi:hypothetical protein